MSGRPRSVVRRLASRALGRGLGERRLVAPEFDRAYYLSANPDVAAAHADPLGHFLAHGWREGRDPNPHFSVVEYLDINADVAEAGLNPFVHFLRNGRHEGRPTAQDLGFRYKVIRRLLPIEDQIAKAERVEAGDPPGAVETLAEAFARSRTGLADLHITFSHDDYRTSLGGLQLCLQQEAARIGDLGRDHLHLHPAHRWPVIRADGEAGHLEVLLNGKAVGVFAPPVVAAALRGVGGGGERSFAIHSLLGHAAEETAAIVEAAGLRAGFLWLHDYASLCAGFHLLRNGVEDCAAPAPDSAGCGICVYGPARGRHLAAHETLFRRLALTVVSPAAATLAFWRKAWDFPAVDAVVHPHATLTPRRRARPSAAKRPLRVAYVGMPAAHKGWPLFRELAVGHARDPRYDFLHLGAGAEGGLPVEFHAVKVTAQKPRAMLDALEQRDVDVVLFWPLWRETFSFATYEAIAAGCAVLTGPDTGNVAAVVEAGGHGWVLSDEEALAEAFDSGRVSALARAARQPMLYDMTLSGMTADLIRARVSP